jgi:hypothetical protein
MNNFYAPGDPSLEVSSQLGKGTIQRFGALPNGKGPEKNAGK